MKYIISTNHSNLIILIWIERRDLGLFNGSLFVEFEALDAKLQSN